MNHHWRDIIKPPIDAVIPIVREFYANLRVKHESHEVRVRGKMGSFHHKSINTLYNLPTIDDDGYTTFKQEPVEFDELIEYLCYPGAVWKLNANRQVVNFQARFLKQETSAVFLFITARLMPTKHATDVTKERAILIYCIFKGYTVDIEKVIEASILYAVRENMNISLPYSS